MATREEVIDCVSQLADGSEVKFKAIGAIAAGDEVTIAAKITVKGKDYTHTPSGGNTTDQAEFGILEQG